MRILGKVVLAAILCLVLPFAAMHTLAQSPTSSISGIVTDPSGAIVPGVNIAIRNIDTKLALSKQSNENGGFIFPLLPIGNYEVTAEITGFEKFVQRPVALTLNPTFLTVKLSLAGVRSIASVAADVPMVNTVNSQGSVGYRGLEVANLPIQNLGALGAGPNDIYAFALGSTGVIQLNQNNTTGPTGLESPGNGKGIRSGGTAADGQSLNEPTSTGKQLPINNPDVVQEAQIITNQFAAENGGVSGVIVSVVTKSGTDQFHGSASWYHNSNSFNSMSNLDKAGGLQSAPLRIENQIGGTVGGPTGLRDTFFFASLQRWTDRYRSSGTTISSAPTVAGRELLQAYGGARATTQALLNNLPAAQSAKTADIGYCFNPAPWIGPGAPPAATPDPNNPGQFLCSLAGFMPISVPVGSFNYSNLIRYNDWQGSLRVDRNFTSKQRLSIRYMFNDDLQTGTGQATPPGLANIVPSRSQAATIGLVSTLSPNFFNELRLSWSRYAFYTGPQNPDALRIPSIEIADLGLTGFASIGPRTALGYPSNLPEGRRNNIYQLTDNMSWTHGKHTLKWGVDIRKQELASESNPNVRGQLRYSTLTNLVADFADTRASLNRPLPGGEFVMHFHWTDWFSFIQDDWRVARNLTLNLGLRYELPGNSIDSLYPLNDRIIAANGGNPLFRYNSRPPRDTNNLMPRIGFNWNLGETGVGLLKKFDLRGGYARTNDYAFLIMAIQIAGSFPFQAGFSIPNTPGTMDGLANLANQSLNIATAPMLSQTLFAPDFHTPYSDQYSLELQRQIGTNNTIRVGYVGTKGTGLFQSLEGNPVTRCGLSNCPRLDPTRGVIRVRANTGSSIYHSMQVSFDHQFSRGFGGGVHYTRSTFIDNGSEIVNPSTSEVATPQDPFNRNAGERARSAYDRPNRLTGNLIYELPFLKDRTGALRHIAGGLQLGTNVALQSGAPFTVLNGSDPGNVLLGSLIGQAIRPNFAPNVNIAELKNLSVSEIRSRVIAAGSPSLYFRALTSNGGPTAAAPIGNVPRNLLRSDGIVSIDLNIVKNIRMDGGRSIQIRADIFNLPNTRNFGIPNASANTTAFNFLNEGATDGGSRRIFGAVRFRF